MLKIEWIIILYKEFILNMKIYDCIMYFDEDLNLDLRFNILDKYVDKFVVVEATRNHAGEEKEQIIEKIKQTITNG